jgi:hypothetical protein
VGKSQISETLKKNETEVKEVVSIRTDKKVAETVSVTDKKVPVAASVGAGKKVTEKVSVSTDKVAEVVSVGTDKKEAEKVSVVTDNKVPVAEVVSDGTDKKVAEKVSGGTDKNVAEKVNKNAIDLPTKSGESVIDVVEKFTTNVTEENIASVDFGGKTETETNSSATIKSEHVLEGPGNVGKEPTKPVASVNGEVKPDKIQIQSNSAVEDDKIVALLNKTEGDTSENVLVKETRDLKNVIETSSSVKIVSASEATILETKEGTSSKTVQDSGTDGTKTDSKNFKNDVEAKSTEPEVLVSSINPTPVVVGSVDLKKHPIANIDKSTLDDVQATPVTVQPTAPSNDEETSYQEVTSVKRNEKDINIELQRKVSKAEKSDKAVKKDIHVGMPGASTDKAQKEPENSDKKVVSKDSENSPNTDSGEAALKSKSASSVDSAAISTDSSDATVAPEVDASDGTGNVDCSDASMQNETECTAEGNSNYIMNIAIIRTIMKDR